MLEDLWLNALRRAELGLYDDALARLYRLAEATVQTYLALKDIDTSAVPYSRLEPTLRDKLFHPNFKNTKLSMTDALTQLRFMDPECKLLKVWPERAPEWQGQRNNSILAHGFKPIGKDKYLAAEKWFRDELMPLWKGLLGRDLLPQLPNAA